MYYAYLTSKAHEEIISQSYDDLAIINPKPKSGKILDAWRDEAKKFASEDTVIIPDIAELGVHITQILYIVGIILDTGASIHDLKRDLIISSKNQIGHYHQTLLDIDNQLRKEQTQKNKKLKKQGIKFGRKKNSRYD